jgi:methylthioribose-1-phosphate isomerase
VEIIDQTKLPHQFVTVRLESMRDAERAIKDMQVSGAPLIGVTAVICAGVSSACAPCLHRAGRGTDETTGHSTKPASWQVAGYQDERKMYRTIIWT